jgi:two-component system, cell cycle sensor histidine kinase and response regulator CckA
MEERSEYPRGTETILVLEDEESLRQVTCECLTTNGYNVLQAGRGNHAIDVAEQFKGPIALIVSDVVLPDMSGPSVATKVRALHPEAKVLYVSGYAEVPVAQQLITEGAILLQKPLSRGDLLSKESYEHPRLGVYLFLHFSSDFKFIRMRNCHRHSQL